MDVIILRLSLRPTHCYYSMKYWRNWWHTLSFRKGQHQPLPLCTWIQGLACMSKGMWQLTWASRLLQKLRRCEKRLSVGPCRGNTQQRRLQSTSHWKTEKEKLCGDLCWQPIDWPIYVTSFSNISYCINCE